MKILIFLSIVSLSFAWALKCFEEEPLISDKCFETLELEKFANIAIHLEKLNSNYVNLLSDARFVVEENQPGADIFMGFELPETIQNLTLYGNTIVTFLDIVLHYLKHNYDMTTQQALYCFHLFNITADEFGFCKSYEQISCNERNKIYQPTDGICTNDNKNPYIGAQNTPYNRVMKNSYEDSIHEVRASIRDKSNLPSARLISSGQRTLYIKTIYNSHENLNNDLLLFYMKIVIIDIMKTLKEQTSEGSYGFECCDLRSTRFDNRHCFPIEVPEKDQMYRDSKCLNYVRAMITHDNCEFKEASILNAVTHYIDMDFIYDDENIKDAMKNDGIFIDDDDHVRHAILVGDERVAMIPQLYAIVVVWIKFHNVIIEQFREIYPDISDETLFYETRRVVIAIYQNIWLREVLPLIVSEESIARYELDDKKACFNSDIDSIVSVEFATAVGRYFHKFIQNNYTVKTSDGRTSIIQLRDLYYNDINAYDEYVSIINGLLDVPWNTEELTNYLFSSNSDAGIDLIALDVQAERDFGVATYCDYLYHFNLTNGTCLRRFSDLKEFINDENLSFLKYAYDDPHDIDLSVGAEMHQTNNKENELLSDIFDELFAKQFHKLKCGDPYFYTNALSHDQISIIEDISFADVLCAVAPDMSIQSFAFLTPGTNNTIQACENTKIDLDGWKLLASNHADNEANDE